MNLRWKIAQFFESRWWRNYLHGKPESQYLDWKRRYWQQFLDENEVWPADGANLLDAGCGPAGIFIIFPHHPVTAIDPLLENYTEQFNFLQNGAFQNVHFVEMPLEMFQSPPIFDQVFCLNAINHVANLDICLRNLHHATKKNGRLILTVDAHNYLFFKKLFKLIPGDILHPHQYSIQEYLEKIENSGFQILRVKLLNRNFFFSYFVIIAQR